jgi:hypothetical protein
MESPYQDIPEIPASFDGKLKMLREQFDILMGAIRDTLNAPFATESSVEASILRNVARDLEIIGPDAFEAFDDVKKAHLAIADEAVKLASELPEMVRAVEEQSARDLACYAAENLVPPAPEPVPTFVELLDIESDWSGLESLVRAQEPSKLEVEKPPVTTGNIWENWYPDTTSQAPKKAGLNPSAEYLFPLELLKILGLEVEPEKQLPPGGNIWENWK